MIAPLDCPMTDERLARILERSCDQVQGRLGFWECLYQDTPLLVITDESHDRMRIMTLVTEEAALDEDEYRRLLSANFDRALDARYAISDGQLWSVFIHPLGSLTESLATSALSQVKNLADNFGTTYISSELVFEG